MITVILVCVADCSYYGIPDSCEHTQGSISTDLLKLLGDCWWLFPDHTGVYKLVTCQYHFVMGTAFHHTMSFMLLPFHQPVQKGRGCSRVIHINHCDDTKMCSSMLVDERDAKHWKTTKNCRKLVCIQARDPTAFDICRFPKDSCERIFNRTLHPVIETTSDITAFEFCPCTSLFIYVCFLLRYDPVCHCRQQSLLPMLGDSSITKHRFQSMLSVSFSTYQLTHDYLHGVT